MKTLKFSRKVQTSIILAASVMAISGLPLFASGFGQDSQEPEPPIVDPGPVGGPPSDAIVLFDGTSLEHFQGSKGAPAAWKVESGYMEATRTGGISTKQEFGDFQLHVEWAAPSVVTGDGQGRGNSGVYLQGRYEVQVLDSYDNKTYPNGQCGAFYGHNAPLVNACRKPGEWQTYDIVFHAPKRGPEGAEVSGSLTVLQNGVLIQDHIPIGFEPTTGAESGEYSETGPIYLQDHGNPVRYRNLWIRPLP